MAGRKPKSVNIATNNTKITLSIGDNYRELLGLLARSNHRSMSDQLRYLIDNAAISAGLTPIVKPVIETN